MLKSELLMKSINSYTFIGVSALGLLTSTTGRAGPVVVDFMVHNDGCPIADYPVDKDDTARRSPHSWQSTEPRIEWSRCDSYLKKPKKKKPTPPISQGFYVFGDHHSDPTTPIGSVRGFVRFSSRNYSGRILTSLGLTGNGIETHEGETFGSLTFLATRFEQLEGARKFSPGWVLIKGEQNLRISPSLSQSLADGIPVRADIGIGHGYDPGTEPDGPLEEVGSMMSSLLDFHAERKFKLNYTVISPQFCSQSAIHDDPSETLLRGDNSDHVLWAAICYGLIPRGRVGYYPNWEERSSTVLKRVDLYESLAHSPHLLGGIVNSEAKVLIQSVMQGRIQSFYRWANQHYSSPLRDQLILLKEYRDTLIHLIGQPVKDLMKEAGTWRRKKRILSELTQSIKSIPLVQTNQSVAHLVDQLEDSIDAKQSQAPAEIEAVLVQLDTIAAGLDQKILFIQQEVERYASN